MRLLQKTTLLYVLLTLIVFGIGSYLMLHSMQQLSNAETDYTMDRDMDFTIAAIKEGYPLEYLNRGDVQVRLIEPHADLDTQVYFKDTLATHYYTKRLENYRKLSTNKVIQGKAYHIQIIDIFFEKDDLIEAVRDNMGQLLLLLLGVWLLAMIAMSYWLLEPFRKILAYINHFNVREPDTLTLPKMSTREFAELSHFVQQMARKAKKDYQTLKEFSENASHEIQTPLAIAQGKLDLLLESEGLDSDQLKLISASQQSLYKLSRLGQTLTLISKIENEEFQVQEAIDISQIAHEELFNFEEISAFKGIELQSEISPDIRLSINPELAHILFSNLIKNAIQHNQEGGWVKLIMNEKGVEIHNPGPQPQFAMSAYFERFRKNDPTSNSLGLGLSIIRKICDLHGIRIDYSYAEGIHRFCLIYPER